MSDAPPRLSFLARFAVLRGATRELWIVFGAKLLAILAYGVMNSTLVLWLSSDLGFGDRQALGLVAAWSLQEFTRWCDEQAKSTTRNH